MMRLAFLSAIAALLLLPEPAAGMLTRLRTPEQMTVEASAVVRGKVVEQHVEVDAETGRTRTVSSVEVLESLKGNDAPGATIHVRQPGGHANGVTVLVSGTAPLQVGHEVLLFLVGGEGGTYHLLGLAQGVWFVTRDRAGVMRLSHERPVKSGAAELPDVERLPSYDGLAERVRRVVSRPTEDQKTE